MLCLIFMADFFILFCATLSDVTMGSYWLKSIHLNENRSVKCDMRDQSDYKAAHFNIQDGISQGGDFFIQRLQEVRSN